MAVETISSRRAAAASRHPGLVSAGLTARRAMRGALVWGAVFGLSAWVEVSQFANQYPTAADRTRLVETMGSSVGLQAIFGPSPMIDTPGGYMAAHAVGVFGVIIGAVSAGLFAATATVAPAAVFLAVGALCS